MEKTVGELLLEQYKGLIASEALKVWSRLPKQTRAWIGLDDMIAQGVLYAWRKVHKEAELVHLSGKNRKGKHRQWDKNKGRNFGSYMVWSLYRDFDNDFIAPLEQSKKRCESTTVSVQALQEVMMQKEKGDWSFESIMKDKPTTPVYDCVIVNSVSKLHDEATPDLRGQMIRWFLDRDKTKLRTSGQAFVNCRHEFLRLADKYRLTIDDCRHVVSSPVCLDLLSRKVRGIPYNLNDPTPGIAVRLYRSEVTEC